MAVTLPGGTLDVFDVEEGRSSGQIFEMFFRAAWLGGNHFFGKENAQIKRLQTREVFGSLYYLSKRISRLSSYFR